MARKPGNTRDATRAAIIEAAETVFTEKGFAGASLSEVASVAGVTKSLIHYHFRSKEELWQHVKETRFTDFAARQMSIFDQHAHAEGFLRESFTAYFQFLKDNPRFLRLMWWMQAEFGRSLHPEHDSRVAEAMRSIIGRGVSHVTDWQKEGELRGDMEPRFMVAAFLSLLRHWFVARRDFAELDGALTEEEVDAQYLHAVIDIFLYGVMPRGVNDAQRVPPAVATETAKAS